MAMTRTITALALAMSLTASTAAPQTQAARPAWLPPGADLRGSLADRPREILRPGSESFYVRLGRLLFRAPAVLGTKAREIGLSCDACHTDGGANTSFLIPGVSDRPGNVDISHRFWFDRGDDGRDDPVNIPSLRGVRLTAPYGHDGRAASLRDFVRHVIVAEFGGPEPSPLTLDALAAYLDALALPAPPDPEPNSAAGRGAAPGAAIFARDCARCHIPDSGFIDRRSHDVGSGGRFDTPTLLGVATTAPYFHDGRYPDLPSVVAHFAAVFGLTYTDSERADLVAYLTAIGTVPGSHGPVSLAKDLAQLAAAIGLLTDTLNDEDGALTGRIALLLRNAVGRIHGRFTEAEHGPARDVLAGWAIRLRAIGQLAAQRRFAEGRAAVSELRRVMAAERGIVARAVPGSLYDVGAAKNQ